MIVSRVEYDEIVYESPLTFQPGEKYLLLLIKSACTLTRQGRSICLAPGRFYYAVPKMGPAALARFQSPLTLKSTTGMINLDYLEFQLDEKEAELFASLPIITFSPSAPANFADLSLHIKDIYNMFYSGDKYRVEKADAMLRLLIYCTASGDETPEETSSSGQLHYRLRKLRRLVSDDPTRFGSVEEAATFAGLSPSWFQTCYKDYFGRSFISDVIHIKIRRACALLESTDWTVSRISENLGFEYESYFYRLFKEYTGRSPRQYRKSRK